MDGKSNEESYKEVNIEEFSSMLHKPKRVVIGPCEGQKIQIYPSTSIYLRADVYDDFECNMENRSCIWSTNDLQAIQILPISPGIQLGCKSSQEVYIVALDKLGSYQITAIYSEKEIKIQSTIEVVIMEKTTTIAKNSAPTAVIDTAKEIAKTTPEPAIKEDKLPIIQNSQSEQIRVNNNMDIERKITSTKISLTETSLEERRKQQQEISSQHNKKSFLTRTVELTDPTTNQDAWVATMAYICFATGFTYIEQGNYLAGALLILCFSIFAIAKQGLPEGPFTRWIKQRSSSTISNVRKTIIGDK